MSTKWCLFPICSHSASAYPAACPPPPRAVPSRSACLFVDQTATEVAAILTKRKKGASVLPANQFDELCSKLEKKYGEAPADAWRSSQRKQEEEEVVVEESTHSDQIDTSSEAVQIDVLRAFYRKFDPEKVRTDHVTSTICCGTSPQWASQIATATASQVVPLSDLLPLSHTLSPSLPIRRRRKWQLFS